MQIDRTRHCSAEDVGTLALEPLERRAYFSAPYEFAAVGIRFDGGGVPQAYLAEGTIGSDSAITGTTRFATLIGAGVPQPIDWTSYNRTPGGTFEFGTRTDFTPYHSQSGTQFLVEERYAVGTFVGRDDQGSPRDYAVLAQRALDELSLADFRNALIPGLQLQMTRLVTQGQLESVTVDVTLNHEVPETQPLELTFRYQLASGEVTAVRQVASYESGRLTLDDGEVLMLSGSRDAAILADLNNADGIVGIASGRVFGGDRQNGRYRGNIVVSGPLSAAFFGVDPSAIGPTGTAVADVVFDLNLNSLQDPTGAFNTFSIYRQSEFDAGNRTPIVTGHWRDAPEAPEPFLLPTTRTELVADDGTVVVLRGGIARYLTFDELNGPADGHEELFGNVASAVRAGHQVVEYQAHVDASGHPIAFVDARFVNELLITSPYSIDLVEEVGGSPVVGELTTSNYEGAQFWAGVSATGEVQVWRFQDQYGWTYSNLTASLPGARPVVGGLYHTEYSTDAFFEDPSRKQFLSGFDADGQFVVYQQTGGQLLDPASVWTFVDAEANGFGGGATRPEFTTGLSGWGSLWGAAHFAGLDTSGDIWSIWWAPTLSQWQVTEISTNSGTPALVGELSVIRTPWSTFHLHGTDPSGNLIVTWWAPGFTNWQAQNLTQELGGPTLAADSLTSNYHVGLGTMNIVGRDPGGQARDYWWTASLGWRISTLSIDIEPSLIPTGPWQITGTTWATEPLQAHVEYSQSLLGHNVQGDLVRLLWRSHEPDAWELQNLTLLSLRYFP
ncbi:MAG: hypothetical protein H7210_01905 [Pyrinomonadaceae bacterium]|nr:hypothetical protein [Phycisphaerales bacterium]